MENVKFDLIGFFFLSPKFDFTVETKSTLPLSSEDVTVSPTTTVDNSRRENAQSGVQQEENVQQLPRESGDGASANPTETESTNAYQRRTKTRTGSLFDDDDEEENGEADQPATTN